MSTLSPERWKAASPLLDEGLALPDRERAAWLDALTASDPALASDVRTLLEEHERLARGHFLEGSPVPPQAAPIVEGQTFGTYTLESFIGRGGMGHVWLARRSDGRFERKAAVKLLNVAFPGGGMAERFKREGEILGRLSHPHIAELLDAGIGGTGQPFLVLEHVEGEPIDRHCDARTLDLT